MRDFCRYVTGDYLSETENPTAKTIFGFDILPMSSTSREGGVRVALVIKETEGKVRHFPNVSREKLFHLAKQYKPSFIGTDNPAEILLDKETISSLSRKLPTQTELVHVNLLNNGTAIPMSRLVKMYDLQKNRKKMSPIRTAEAIIQLIELGVGMILEPFEKETIIDVGRPRSRGKGGWSQGRYERQGEEIVHRATEEIRTYLDSAKISFDLTTRKTKYGALKSRFHIFSSRELIGSKIKNLSIFPAKLKIWSPTKEITTHRPLSRKNDPRLIPHIKFSRLMVGIDPGMTTGVAISTLSGKILNVFSRKNLSKGELVSQLTNFGTPAAICADVTPVPAFVSKLAATYNAEIISPGYELSQDEKRELTREYASENKLDAHQRDALSAVMSALMKFQSHFSKLRQYEFNPTELDIAMGMIVRGSSIHESVTAIEILRNKEQPKEEIVLKQETSQEELVGRIYNLINDMTYSEETISNLRAHITRLESKIYSQERLIHELRILVSNKRDRLTREILEEDLIEQKELVINHLRNRLKEEFQKSQLLIQKSRDLEEILGSSLDENKIPIKVLPVFSHQAIYQLQLENGLFDGDIILIVDPTGGGPQTCLNLIETNFRIIFYLGKLPHIAEEIFLKNKLPFANAAKYNIHRINQYAIISESDLIDALTDFELYFEKKQLEERRKKIDLEIVNYQYQREKEQKKNQVNYDDYEPKESEDEDLL